MALSAALVAAFSFLVQPQEAKAQVSVQIGSPGYVYPAYGVSPYAYAPYYGSGLAIGNGGFNLSFGSYPNYGYSRGYRPAYGSFGNRSFYGHRGGYQVNHHGGGRGSQYRRR